VYDVVLTDRAHTPVGQLTEAASVNCFRGLGKLSTCAFQIPLSNAHTERLAACDGHIKVYRKGSLLFVGPIITAEENAERETRSIAVTAADAGWYLGKRVVGKSTSGTLWTTATARHTIAKSLVDTANTEFETGIDTSFYTWTSGSAITYKAGPYALCLPIIQELGAALDGYDWFVYPRENWVNGAVANQKIGSMNVQTLIGSAKPNVVFEYGTNTRSNVLSYTKTTTRDTQANTVYHVGTDGSAKVGFLSVLGGWPLMDDVISGEFTDPTYRQKLVDEHVAVRGMPRTLMKMTPHIDPGVTGRVPEPFIDYDIGDTITFRAVAENIVRFSGTLRVYGIRSSIDPSGFERVELVLEDE
jgi:hypothetical protein